MSHCTDVSALCDVDDKALLEFIRQRYVSEHNGWEVCFCFFHKFHIDVFQILIGFANLDMVWE